MTNEEMEKKIQEAEETLKKGFCCKGFHDDYEESVGLAKRVNAIFMVHVKSGENYDADKETLAAELDRLFCIMNDEEWDSLIEHPGLGHCFKGGLSQARKYMQGKPVGTRSSTWQWRVVLPKAIIPKCQAALDEFTKNEFWKDAYESAPHCIKVMEELQYYEQWYEERHNHEPQGEEAKELDRIRAENYAKMKKSDWLYLADHCYSAMERSLIRPHYLRAAAKCKE